MTVVDVHTHMLSEAWLDLLQQHGGEYGLMDVPGDQQAVHRLGAPFMTLTKEMFDYPLRIRNMDNAGVDVAVVSLTCPNVFWGGAETSAKAAALVNDDLRGAQATYPDRIRWLANLPWQYADQAVKELDRALSGGAVGVMVLANIAGESLTGPRFTPVWEAINERRLPVLVHPTIPPGSGEADLEDYNLVSSVGFMMDTTMAITRMVFDGFFDRYPDVKIIACHGGGTLPYLAGRLDKWHQSFLACRERIERVPSDYLAHIYYDSVVYTQEALELCLSVTSADHVLFGSDYAHNVGDMGGCLARVDTLAPDVAKRVRGENAVNLFRL